MNVIEEIEALFAEKGQGLYFGEQVTETDHALQCAHLAEQAGAPDALVAAALLHDIGHLLHHLPEDAAEQGVDAHHEDEGASWLKQYFGKEVVDPVRLHVAAKRYLCATEPKYLEDLSPASQLSLKLQGGLFTTEEIQAFEAEPWFESAIAVRRWDDAAKIPDLVVPGVKHYRPVMERLLKGES
jgi:[1-hydroxy-2-(trimethylamino)ethyl]phosphonate dioxygenase